MYFKRLDMQGFKSFAEPVSIEFHEGITCIVGPNGSGKSNISDAIRWVLGEQSPKLLRGGRMEEVIFAGTASRRPRGMAEVTLVIDNTAGLLPIEYDEVAITRRMYRSGESEYLLNNNQCRLKDIRELIMDTGIGVEGYSIIGQGKIADIVSSKPESRREIFEEAAGIVLYKSRKAEAERKLSAASANLERVGDVIGEIEGRIDGLRADSERAQTYVRLRDRYRDLEVNLTLRTIDRLTQSGTALAGDIEDLTARIEEAQRQRTDAEASLTEARKESETLEQRQTAAQDALVDRIDRIHHLTSRSQVNEERLASIGREQARLLAEASDLEEKRRREMENADSLRADREQLARDLAQVEATLREKGEMHRRAVEEADALTAKADQVRQEIFDLQGDAAASEVEVRSLESMRETLLRRREQLTTDQKQLAENAANYTALMEKAQKERDDAVRLMETLRDALEEARTDQKTYEASLKALTGKRETLRLDVTRYTARKKTIEEMEHNYEGYNGAVRFVMRVKRPGIRGVVADLMQVPSGYEVAIETALGPALQNIVCETDADAKTAIQALKENQAGRCTFLPLGSVHGRRAAVERRVEQVEGYLGLAVDCIRYAPAYEGIFTYLLGRTSVVDTMDNAVRLSKMPGTAGVRFVTLEGEVINASGAITGGRYRNATANLLSRKQEILALEEAIGKAHQGIAGADKEERELTETLREMTAVIADTERDFHQAELTAGTMQARMQTLAESSRDADAGRVKADRELTTIEADLTRIDGMAEAEREKARQLKAAATAKETALQAALADGQTARASVEAASEAVTKTRIEKNACEEKVKTLAQLLERVEGTAADLGAQAQEKRAQRDKLEAEKTTILYGRADAADTVEALEGEKAALEAEITSIRGRRADLAQEISRLEGEEGAARETLQACSDQRYQFEIRKTRNDAQLESSKERLWTEFELSYAQALTMRREDFSAAAAGRESREIREALRDLGTVNLGAIQEYEEVRERYEFLTAQRDDIRKAEGELRRIIADMDQTIRSRFRETFDQVAAHFETVFRELFGGGHAQLKLDQAEDPLEAGIEIIAQPPGKRLQNINLMSGGEKTMTAIALMFAVLRTKPTPFCILDEVEAALDDANIDRFATYLRRFHDIQFAIITHQKATMEHADVLYGVTMPEQGISRVLSLKLGDAAQP